MRSYTRSFNFSLNDFCWIHWIQSTVTKFKIRIITMDVLYPAMDIFPNEVLDFILSTRFSTWRVWLCQLAHIWVFPKCFQWIRWIQCKRPGCYNSVSKTHVRDRIIKMTPIHASVIYQIPSVHWILVPFRENSTDCNILQTVLHWLYDI